MKNNIEILENLYDNVVKKSEKKIISDENEYTDLLMHNIVKKNSWQEIYTESNNEEHTCNITK